MHVKVEDGLSDFYKEIITKELDEKGLLIITLDGAEKVFADFIVYGDAKGFVKFMLSRFLDTGVCI